MTHHTPGPWTVSCGDIVRAGNRIVADCERLAYADRPRPSVPEDCANARLIASAPDMLDALEAVYTSASVGSDSARTAVIPRKLYDRIRAIVEASGR